MSELAFLWCITTKSNETVMCVWSRIQSISVCTSERFVFHWPKTHWNAQMVHKPL